MRQIKDLMGALKLMREARGISAIDVYKESGISASQLSQIESGNMNIRLSTFLRYINATNFKVVFVHKNKEVFKID